MGAFRILLAEDHPVFRFGLCSLLRSHEGWEVCGEAIDGRDAIEKCIQLNPDLLILDICLPKLNGVDAAQQILKRNPDQAILVLTAVESEQVIRECLAVGVRGWVFKSDGTDELMTAVEALQRHRTVFSPRVSDLIMEGYRRHGTGPVVPRVSRLSPREREVVQLVGEGMSSKEIALVLKVAVGTAETHRSNILRKLKLHSIAELVLYAVRNEIVHVHLATVLRFPIPGEEGNRRRASSAHLPLPQPRSGPAAILAQSLS
jgi:DNA-binding NarL/FixJ family response regulator